MRKPRNYNSFFQKTFLAKGGYKEVSLGDIPITSGTMVVCDPLAYCAHPFGLSGAFEIGDYEASAIVDTEERRVALGRVVLKGSEVDSWEYAKPFSKNSFSVPTTVSEYGLPVDAGMASFADNESLKAYFLAFSDFHKKHKDKNFYSDFLRKKLAESPLNIWKTKDGDFINYKIPGSKDKTVVIMSSGYGDGAYPVCVGYSKDRKLVAALIDFMVID